MRSSHCDDWGRRSATRAQPISNQSFVHEFGVPWVPPPTYSKALNGILHFIAIRQHFTNVYFQERKNQNIFLYL